ncbi:hypothetical protein Droror1_Dr00022797 [Drosera rotundifolia]
MVDLHDGKRQVSLRVMFSLAAESCLHCCGEVLSCGCREENENKWRRRVAPPPPCLSSPPKRSSALLWDGFEGSGDVVSSPHRRCRCRRIGGKATLGICRESDDAVKAARWGVALVRWLGVVVLIGV